MLATRELPAGFSEWNRRWGAPLGRRVGTGRLDETRLHVRALRVLESRTTARIRFCGPFAWQWNSALRQFEYPWVFESVSAIEHLAPADLAELAEHARRILRPGGIAVLTIDLFLDLRLRPPPSARLA